MKKLSCEDISCGNCETFIHIGGGMRKCGLSIPKIYKSISLAKKELDKPDHDAQIAVIILRDTVEVKLAGLTDLAWALYKDGSLHKNDVIGLIENLEKWLEENELST